VVVQIDPTTGKVLKTIASVSNPTGMTVNPLNGHLLVSSYQVNNVYDIDPTTGTTTLFTNAFLDGLSVSGTTLYGADPGTAHVLGFDLKTKAQVFDSGAISGIPDGTALGAGIFAGNIFANTNGGTLVEIDLKTDVQTVIASGGSRGDFVQVDPNNDTVLVTQGSSIDRLTPPAGGGFGSGTGGSGAVPLPGAVWMGLEVMGGLFVLKMIGANRMRAV
jgi:DNA-binding beta-propeller fold protein YncE